MRQSHLVALAGLLASWSLSSIASSSAPIAALVDGQPISVADVDAKASADLAREDANFNEAQRRAQLAHRATVQALKEATLDGLIRERSLAAEAKKTGKSAEEILAGHSAAEPTDDEMRAYYKANATPSAPPYEQVKSVIRERLMAESRQKAEADLARELRARHSVEWRLPRERLDVSPDGPARGPSDAVVTLVEFADFQCPYCNRLEPVIKAAMSRYPKQLKHVYRQLPIPQLHPGAQLAAQASLCANEQNLFWPMHDAFFAFFAGKGTLDLESLAMLGEASGLEPEAFASCLKSGKADGIIAKDAADADRLGVDGTPALFLNGRPLRGGVSEDSLNDAIDEEIARIARSHE